MKLESSYWGGIGTRGLQRRQVLRAAGAATTLLTTILAFVGLGRVLVQDAAAAIVQAAVTPADLAADIVWTTYLVAYALLLLAAVAIWVTAVALTIWPPKSGVRSS